MISEKTPAEASATPEAIIASEALPGGYSEPDYTADIEAAEAQIPDPPPGPEPFALVPFADMLKEPAPIRWLIKGWLQRGALQMIHGAPGAGKSFVCLDWALHVAAGFDTWGGAPGFDRPGHKVRGGAVVYLTGEGHNGLKKRLAAWAHHNEAREARISFSQTAEALNTEQGYETVRQAIEATGERPALVIVDTLHNHNQGDENSSKDAWGLIHNCRRLIQEYGCTVLLVHHTGLSDADRARGSSAYRAAVDLETSCKKSSHIITLEQKKNKEDETARPLYFELHRVVVPGWTDEDGEPVASAVILPTADKPTPAGTTKKGQHVLTAERAYEQAVKNAPERDKDGQFLGVHLEAWRKAFYELSTADNQGTKRRSFNRARETLVEALGEFSKDGDIYKRKGSGIVDNLLFIQSGTRDKAGQSGTNVPANTGDLGGTGRDKTL